MHEKRGVTHRDVKTENVLFTGEPPLRVKLVDFGLAVRKTREMYERSVDVWGAGVCLHECATGGRLPFGGNPRVENFSKLQSVPGELTDYLEDVVDGRSEVSLGSVGVAQLLRGIFRKEFFKRPRCSEVLKHDWFKN